MRRQIQDTPGGGHAVVDPKYGSVRTVAIPAHLARQLRRHLHRTGLGDTPDAYVIPGRHGRPIAIGTLTRA